MFLFGMYPSADQKGSNMIHDTYNGTAHRPRLVDTTLREGQQAARVYFTKEQRREMLLLLGQTGVDEIEIGYAAKDANLLELTNEARSCAPSSRIAVWCRALPNDIAIALSAKPDVISVSVPVSDLHIEMRLRKSRQWVLDQIASMGALVSQTDPSVVASLGLEDATRADRAFLREAAAAAERAGFRRIRIADTVGIGNPQSISNIVSDLRLHVSMEIGVHMHNDFGMATANAICALQTGADWADVSVLGVGERSGIARLEEVVGYLHILGNRDEYNMKALGKLTNLMADAGQDTISKRHPIVGSAIFE